MKDYLKHYEDALWKLLLCEEYNDFTSPTSNQIPDTHIAVSVVYNTFLKILFRAFMFILFNPSF